MTADVEQVRAPVAGEGKARRAKQRAEAVQGLYIHLIVYLVINAGVFVINALTRAAEGTWWFVWPAAIWGIALLIHIAVTVIPVFSPEWAERRAVRMLEDSSR
ncbi:MAG TPA: 2TM domain-containing protein [Rubrobacter sp.]|jgi:2TM domain|nr:2TM domain-containing protein [Rubrobacter sp.]